MTQEETNYVKVLEDQSLALADAARWMFSRGYEIDDVRRTIKELGGR